jgi:hypothetical protein
MASATLEKPTTTQHDDLGHDAEMDMLKGNVEIHFTAQQTKALLRKIDWHLIPFLSLLYLLSFLE